MSKASIEGSDLTLGDAMELTWRQMQRSGETPGLVMREDRPVVVLMSVPEYRKHLERLKAADALAAAVQAQRECIDRSSDGAVWYAAEEMMDETLAAYRALTEDGEKQG